MKNSDIYVNVRCEDIRYIFLFSKFLSYCLNRMGVNSRIIRKKNLKLGEIIISPYLFFKNKNIKRAFHFYDYDMIVFCEKPVIDILDSYNIPTDSKPSYDTRLVGFNNNELLKWWKKGRTDNELYEYCKQHDYKVKVMFSNIMVDEKMKLFGVEWISKDMRKHYRNIIIDYFLKKMKQ